MSNHQKMFIYILVQSLGHNGDVKIQLDTQQFLEGKKKKSTKLKVAP